MAINVRKAFKVADSVIKYGFIPYVPHHTHFWHLISPKPYKFWLELDKEFLKCCDCLLRIPGESAGADEEENAAKSMHMPVFKSIDALVNHFTKRGKRKQNEL